MSNGCAHGSTRTTNRTLAFRLGDYAAGMLTGVLTALAVRLIVGSTWAMVMAMLVDMAVGYQMTGETEATGQDRFTWKK